MLTPLAILSAPDAPSFGVAGIVLMAWPLISIAIIRGMGRPARALITAVLVGWLFLPQTAINSPFVSFDKSVSVELGLLAGMLICYPRALRPRLRLVDLPMVMLCVIPALAALANGLSLYDAAAASAKQIIDWGVPYTLARIYLTTWADARTLAIGIFMAGLVYVPFCVAEEFYQPFLHHAVYGIWQHSSQLLQAYRDGGWRPMVFMQHGLAVAMFMTSACLMGCWLWWTGVLREIGRIPIAVLLVFLLATTVMTRSTGAVTLLPLGLATLYFTKLIHRRVLLLGLLLLPAIYVTARVTTNWNGDDVTSYVQRTFGTARAQSLSYRMWNERKYIDHDRARPLLGYGPGYTFMVFIGEEPVVVDSYWIIELSVHGALGVAAFLLCFGLPVGLLLWRIPVRDYTQPAFSGAIALAVLLLMCGIDNLFNAMFNPIFVLALGTVAALTAAPLAVEPIRRRKKKSVQPQAHGVSGRIAEPRVEDFEHVLAADTLSLHNDE